MVKAWKDMTPLERVTKQAQATANRTGKAVHIFNLNRMMPLYVIRDADCTAPLVTIVNPIS